MKLIYRGALLATGAFLILVYHASQRGKVEYRPTPDKDYARNWNETEKIFYERNAKLPSLNATSESKATRRPKTPSPESDAKTAQRFQNRLKLLRSRCPRWRISRLGSNWVPNKSFLINYPRRILVCAVPKAGSTSWHMAVWAMRRKQAGLDSDTKYYRSSDTSQNHAMSEKLSAEKGDELIAYTDGDDDMLNDPPTEKSKKIILVRHPFARLISGWHQKFRHGSEYPDVLLRRYPRMRGYFKDHDPYHQMSWKNFAEFIAYIGLKSQSLDYHFTPIWELCRPCDYAYTYILKAESVDADESWLKRRLNTTDINVGRKGLSPGGSIINSNPSDNIKTYMSQLDDKIRKRLYKVYKLDFQLFGYSFDFKTLRSGGFY